MVEQMIRKFFACLCACFALLGGSALAASGTVLLQGGATWSASSSACSDVIAGSVSAFGSSYTVLSCGLDPVVQGATLTLRQSGSTSSFLLTVTSITATPSTVVSPSSPVPTDAASLYVVVLAGLIVGCFGVGYLGGVHQ